MNTPLRLRSPAWEALALVPASLTALLLAVSLVSAPAGTDSGMPASPVPAVVATSPGHAATAGRLVLRFPDGQVTVSLVDSTAARELTAILPLDLTLHDPMGQAKSGQLPSPLDVTDAEPLSHGRVGELYYWAPSRTIAIFYDDLGQDVPPPGLVRLGVVASGLESVAAAGNRFRVRVELADRVLTPRKS